MDFLPISVVFSVWGFVWSRILTAPGMIFGGLGLWLYQNVREYWGKPLYSCAACVAGSHCLVYAILARLSENSENSEIAIIPAVIFAVFGGYLLDNYIQ